MTAPEVLPEPGDPRALYVVDLHHYVWRHVAAVGTRGARSFVQWFSRLVEQRRPGYLVCADDALGGSFRADVLREAGYVGDAGYKGNRRKLRDEDLAVLADQREEVRAFVEDMGVPVVSAPGFEADDVVATLVRWVSERCWVRCGCGRAGLCDPDGAVAFECGLVLVGDGCGRSHLRDETEPVNAVIVSCDHDLLQLVGERQGGSTCVMWDGAFDVRGPEGCKRALGVVPSRVPDFFALKGGKNNVPGVDKLGGVRAAALLRDRGAEDLLAALEGCVDVSQLGAELPNGVKPEWGLYLLNGAEQARLGLRLTRLRDDVPLDLPGIFSLARRAWA